jgi:hypothetical protein
LKEDNSAQQGGGATSGKEFEKDADDFRGSQFRGERHDAQKRGIVNNGGGIEGREGGFNGWVDVARDVSVAEDRARRKDVAGTVLIHWVWVVRGSKEGEFRDNLGSGGAEEVGGEVKVMKQVGVQMSLEGAEGVGEKVLLLG